jgi:hypothetical protein
MSASPSADASALALLDEFMAALTDLERQVGQAQVDGRSLQQTFLTAQQCFQQQLLPTLVTLPAAHTLTPLQTEMNRALRLLGIDVSFLQSAQNPMTAQKRQAQMRQRLRQLLDFSQALRTALAPTATPEGTPEGTTESDRLG